MAWSLSGTYFESCNCDAACPCVFLSDPTNEECTVLVAWHIDSGSHEGVDLGGLNVAMAAYVPGNMMQVKWDVALYLDDRASEAQSNALASIFSGQAGGVPAALAEHIGKVLGAGPARIDVQIDGKRRSMRIGDVASLAVETMAGQNGGPVHVSGHPFAVAPGNPVEVGTSDHLRYSDQGLTWEFSGSAAYTSPFQYQA